MSHLKNAPTLGIDLGGTKIKTALVDSSGLVIDSKLFPTDSSRGATTVIDAIGESAHRFLTGPNSAKALGIGVAGQVDMAGTVRFAPNLAWKEVPLGRDLEKALRIPVVVLNDVRAATWGEVVHGTGVGVSELVCVFVGTGIGGGIVSGGRILSGSTFSAGEIGHLTLVAGGRKCHCPNFGCFEAYVGGWAIAERAKEAAAADPLAGSSMVARAGSIHEIVGRTVSSAFHEGDALATEVMKKTAEYLAAGLVSIVNVLNPSMVILGGGIIEGTPELISMAEIQLRRLALPSALEPLKVCRAALGGDAGVIGAAAFARSALQ
ncbi:MAG TPA: ROK family protein [Blastocatellia bacterium]|nr:ROK family protein [Blastocatellia bacterium]